MSNHLDTEVFEVTMFESEDLNELTQVLYSLDEEASKNYKQAKKHLKNAFRNRWEFGEQLWIYEEIIMDYFESWSEFAEKIGKDPSQVSRRFSGFKHLKENGAQTWEEVVDLLEDQSIKLTAKNFERIGRLLNEPEKNKTFEYETQEPKDTKRLQELEDEAREILQRNENKNRNQPLSDTKVELKDQAEETLQYVKDMREKLAKQNPYNVDFKSEGYLEYIRGFGRDLITGEPCERCDPHHTSPENATGKYGKKLPDWSTIPVSRKTHNAITNGNLEPSPEQILKAQVTCLSIFLMTYIK